MLVDVEGDVVVALPKRVVVTLEASLLSGVGLNGDGLLDSVILLLPKIELPNTDVGLDAVSEVLNALVDFVVAKKFGTLLEPKLGVVEAGCDDGLGGEPAVSWLEEPVTDLDVVFSMLEGAASEKLEVGCRLDVGADVLEAANVVPYFGGSGGVIDENVGGSLGLDARPKSNCVGVGLEGGTNGGNVKPPVFVPLSPVGGSLEDTSANPTDSFGRVNDEVVFSGGGFAPKRGVELVVTEAQIVGGSEEPSNSD